MLDSSRLVAEPGLPSREVATPCRVFSLETLAPSLLRRSPLALGLCRLDFRVFAFQAPGGQYPCPRDPLLGFGSSSEVAQAPSRCIGTFGFPGYPHSAQLSAFCSASLEVLSPAASSRSEQRHEMIGLALPTACASRFSQPHGAFIRPEPAGLVSCRIRSWGVSPSELCSSRAAVRCFQRHSPLDVPTVFRVLLHARIRLSVQGFSLKPSAWLS